MSLVMNLAAFGLQRFSPREILWLALLISNILLALGGLFKTELFKTLYFKIRLLYLGHVGHELPMRRSSSREQIVSNEHSGANSTTTFATMNGRVNELDQALDQSMQTLEGIERKV
ncbi:hypothetical protein PV08_12084 [Exophiala spinifera]|uniref:Uncharacterized protein n=1 Tax=Exophiala spinifera TaxID=91928 RepID=A0A0D2BE53_9EURO|nr:uncharacterized protein PV08_12084 [Exophiala spinifera]KIW09669.1 hypothetical protein PV08_12084 [Exophiala spinifera]